MSAHIKLGYAPTRRAIFSAPAAVEYRKLTANRLKELTIDFVDIDDINEEGLLYDDAGLEKIIEKFQREKGKITLTARVPVNASASIILERGAENPESELRFARNAQGQWQAETGSGTWTVTYQLHE